MKDGFYVGVRDPVEVRKSILETSKAVIHDLQSYERLLETRGKKREALSRLKKKVDEINALLEQLRKVLPEVRVESEKPAAMPKLRTAPVKHRIQIVARPKPKTEIEKLNDELKDIESKLGSLG